MNDDAFDELVALYRQSANETAPRRLDARVLRATAAHASARRAWPWLALAFAASLLLWLGTYRAASPGVPGAADEATRAYLLQMDVTPPAAGSQVGLAAGTHGDIYREMP